MSLAIANAGTMVAHLEVRTSSSRASKPSISRILSEVRASSRILLSITRRELCLREARTSFSFSAGASRTGTLRRFADVASDLEC